MKSIINGISVYSHGNSESVPILFVHGFPYENHMWDFQVNELQNYYYCITYDCRGLGASPAGSGQFTMESFVDDLKYIIDGLKINKPVLCGLSMGGYIALRAVERMEDYFSALILCDTKSEADNNEAKLRRAAGIKMINEEGIQKFVSGFIPTCFTENSIRNLPEYKATLERALTFDPVGIKGCLLAMQGRTDTTAYLNKIKIPALVICGKEDKLSPPSAMKGLAEKISNSEFVVVPGAAHMTPLENPEFLNKVFFTFLNKIGL